MLLFVSLHLGSPNVDGVDHAIEVIDREFDESVRLSGHERRVQPTLDRISAGSLRTSRAWKSGTTAVR